MGGRVSSDIRPFILFGLIGSVVAAVLSRNWFPLLLTLVFVGLLVRDVWEVRRGRP